MNVLGGLVRPSAGRASVGGQELLKLSNSALDRYRRTQVGFVWQQGARNLVSYLNARENVEMPMMLAGMNAKQMRNHADELLAMVGLGDRRQHYMPELSGGEQTRVAIAVSLANNPTLLLADEPTGELDSATSATIYEAFRELNARLGLTVLIVSHDPDIAREVNRVMAIRDGKVAGETVRRKRNGGTGDMDSAESTATDEQFEELVVLDSAGRLQVPKEYREALGIGDRVTMELTEDGLVIRPISAEMQTPIVVEPVEPEEDKGMNWFGRFRKSS
jgi:ABC-type lipoprotein export system ATPase subunit/bifunctional DNA-binding transcriptional regulator/antitoxin component of YhaV-PrlF toxin-antitoxin module